MLVYLAEFYHPEIADVAGELSAHLDDIIPSRESEIVTSC